MSEGIIIIAYGENARTEAMSCIASLRAVAITLPIAVVSDKPLVCNKTAIQNIYAMDEDDGARWAKVNLDNLSPFDSTLYVDADTRIMSADILSVFGMLADGWEMVLSHSANQGVELLWHCSEDDKADTIAVYGTDNILQLQGGVIGFRKCEAVTLFFEAWRDEWLRHMEQDQGALLRAMRRSPLRCWILGRPFNGGSLIKHLFGWAKR